MEPQSTEKNIADQGAAPEISPRDGERTYALFGTDRMEIVRVQRDRGQYKAISRWNDGDYEMVPEDQFSEYAEGIQRYEQLQVTDPRKAALLRDSVQEASKGEAEQAPEPEQASQPVGEGADITQTEQPRGVSLSDETDRTDETVSDDGEAPKGLRIA